MATPAKGLFPVPSSLLPDSLLSLDPEIRRDQVWGKTLEQRHNGGSVRICVHRMGEGNREMPLRVPRTPHPPGVPLSWRSHPISL